MTCEHPDRSFDIAWVLGGTEKNVARDRVANLNPLALSNWSHHDGTPNPLLVFLHDGMKK